MFHFEQLQFPQSRKDQAKAKKVFLYMELSEEEKTVIYK